MYRKPKRLTQTLITTNQQSVYQCPDDSNCQVLEIWLNNISDTATSIVTIHAHGTNAENVLVQSLDVNSKNTRLIEDCRIILEQGESIYVTSTIPNIISVTIYGVLTGEISIV